MVKNFFVWRTIVLRKFKNCTGITLFVCSNRYNSFDSVGFVPGGRMLGTLCTTQDETMSGEDSDGRLLSLAADAMVRWYLKCVLKVIYCSTYVGIVFRSLIFETSNFNQSTSKFIVITTSRMLRQLMFCYEDSVRNPQTLQPLES
jgi:hypothetical protein